MRPRLLVALATAALAATATLFLAPSVAHADTAICEKFGSARVAGGRYIVQNNVWGASTPQCINARDDGFTITQSGHNVPTNGAPASYPSIYAGCHYGNCTTGSGLPMRVSDGAFQNVSTGLSMGYAGGQWDAAYDIWFDPTARTDGQNTGAELMVWLNHAGAPQPVGSRVATVNIAGGTWDVWFGNIGWNVVSYVRTAAAGSISFRVRDFYNDMTGRGYAQSGWWLTSVQAGFEPWQGGAGLSLSGFTYSTSGGGTTVPVNEFHSLRVTTAGFANRYVRHQNSFARTDVVDGGSSALLKNDATFRIVPGLANGSCYSFESRNFPGQFLRHQAFRVRIDPNDNSALFRNDATWCAQAGNGGVRFSSLNFPDRFIRHYAEVVYAANTSGANPFDAPGNFDADTTWSIDGPWA